MDQEFKKLIALFGQHRVKLNEPLKSYTYSQFDGTAEAFFIATSQNELLEVITAAQKLKIPLQIIGAGTKVIFPSPQVPGLVIKNRASGIKVSGVKGKAGVGGIGVQEALIEIDSGVSLGKINQFLVTQELPQIHFSSLAQSTLGGAIFNENGLQQIVQNIRVLEQDQIVEIKIAELKRQQIIFSAVLKISL